MDNNVFEILIALYFIFTFIGGYLKKKKKEEAKRDSMHAVSEEVPLPVESKEDLKAKRDRETREMLNKIFGVQIPHEEKEDFSETVKDEYIPKENIEELPTWNPEDDFKEEDSYSPEIRSQEFLSKQYEAQQTSSEFEKPTIIKEDNTAEKIPTEISNSEFLHNKLLRRLKNPQTLKEAILLAEILNKPKALRRYG